MDAKQKKILSLILAAVVVGGSIGGYFIANKVAEDALNEAEITISSMDVKDIGDSSITVEISGEITNPSEVEATLEPMEVSVLFDGKEIGTTEIEKIEILAAVTEFDQELEIEITDDDEFADFIAEFLEEDEVDLTIKGTATLGSGALSLEKEIEKEVTVDGMDDGFDVTVDDVQILEVQDRSFKLNVSTTFTNPSSVSVDVDEAQFEVSWDDNVLGDLTLTDLSISKGTHIIHTNCTIEISDAGVFSEMIEALADADSIQLDVSGKSSGDLLDCVISAMEFQVDLDNIIRDATFVLNNFTIVDINSDSIILKLNVTANNPIASEITVDSVNLNITYESAVIGSSLIEDITLDAGINEIIQEAEILITNSEEFGGFVEDFIVESSLSVDLNGTARIKLGDLSVDVDIDEVKEFNALDDGLSFEVVKFDIMNATTDSFYVNVTAYIVNPSDSAFTLSNLTFDITYNEDALGVLNITSINLTSGDGNTSVICKVTVEDDSKRRHNIFKSIY